jgi:hypothetical protein
MLRRAIVAASFASLAVVAAAGDTQVADPAGRVFVADLGNDGTMEKVLVRKTGSKDGNDFYQLVVQDDTGNEIWAGPKAMDTENPLVFGVWDWGVSLPQALGDIDGDGRVELVAEAPRSDVSPASFRVFSWTGSEFKPVRTLPLLETPAGSGFYPWAQSERYMGCWIDKFEKVGAGGEVTVGMMEYTEGKPPRTGKAVVTAEKNGYRLKKWVSPLKPFEEPADEQAAPGPATKAGANPKSAPLADYMCQIGDEDLRNSAGGRLDKVSDILAMDRANYHKFRIRHRRDLQDETFFATPSNRQIFALVPITIPKNLEEWTLKGGAILQVKVYVDRVVVAQPE